MAGAPLRVPFEVIRTLLREADAFALVHVEVKGAFAFLEWALATAVCLTPEKSGITSLRKTLTPTVYFVPVSWAIIYEDFIAILWRADTLASLVIEYFFAAVARDADAAAGFHIEVVVRGADFAKANTFAELRVPHGSCFAYLWAAAAHAFVGVPDHSIFADFWDTDASAQRRFPELTSTAVGWSINAVAVSYAPDFSFKTRRW